VEKEQPAKSSNQVERNHDPFFPSLSLSTTTERTTEDSNDSEARRQGAQTASKMGKTTGNPEWADWVDELADSVGESKSAQTYRRVSV